MSDVKSMLFEVQTICTVAENLLEGYQKEIMEQFREVCDLARIEITAKNKRIDELEEWKRLAKKAQPQLEKLMLVTEHFENKE